MTNDDSKWSGPGWSKAIRLVVTLVVVLTAGGLITWKVRNLSSALVTKPSDVASRRPYVELFDFCDKEFYPKVVEHARTIAGFGSRMTGQPGCTQTAEYVRSQLAGIVGHENVGVLAYPALVPVEKEAWIEVEGLGRIPAHVFMPNNVQCSNTPPEGLTGPLSYVGHASVEDLTGKLVDGAICLAEFNSADAWLRLINYGAKAVVFLEPTETNFRQADAKYVDLLPVRATRLYVQGADADRLRRAATDNPSARVFSRQTLQEVKAPGFEVIIPGTKSTKTVVMSCHFDARSVVPALSPGGDEVWGVAAWLELVRYYQEHPAANTIRFLAFSGHWQDFVSSRTYVSDHLKEVGDPLVLWTSVDLSTEEPGLGLVPAGGWTNRSQGHGDYQFLERLIWPFPASTRANWYDNIVAATGEDYKLYGGLVPTLPWAALDMGPKEFNTPMTLASRFYGTSDAFSSPGGLNFSFQTPLLHRWHHNTPLDDFQTSYQRRENLTKQLHLLLAVFDNIACLSPESWPKREPKYASLARAGYLEFGGRVQRRNPKTAWYTPGLPPYSGDAQENSSGPGAQLLTNTYVYMYPFDSRNRLIVSTVNYQTPLAPNKNFHRQLQSFSIRYMVKVDPDGSFKLPNVYQLDRFTNYTFMAFSLDDQGNVRWAADMGRYGADEFKYLIRRAESSHVDQNVTIFPCASLTFFDLYDYQRYTLGSNIQNTWYIQWGSGSQQQDLGLVNYLPISEVKLYPSQTDAQSYLIGNYRQTGMVFIPAKTRVELLLDAGPLKKFSLLRSIEGSDKPLNGIELDQGQEHPVRHTAMALAELMHRIDREKLKRYGSKGVKSQQADQNWDKAQRLIDTSKENRQSLRWRDYFSSSMLAWFYESEAYRDAFRLLYDVVSTTIFYFTLLIPFSYLMERLLFPQSTYVRTAGVAGTIFVVFVVLLLIFHPGFHLAGNIYVAITSFLIIVFTLPAFFMIVGSGLKMLKAAGSKYFQRHASEAERLGVLMAALSLSIANMRRRKLRTALTLGTITLLVLALVLLTYTTSTSQSFTRPAIITRTPYRDGIQVTNTHDRRQALFREMTDLVEATYANRCVVARRDYANYGVQSSVEGFESLRLYFSAEGDSALAVQGVVSLPTGLAMPANQLRLTLKLGRWFTERDRAHVLVGAEAAKDNALRPGDQIKVGDRVVTVRGIFSEDTMRQMPEGGGPDLKAAAGQAPVPSKEERDAGRFQGDRLFIACPDFQFAADPEVTEALTGKRSVHVVYQAHYDPVPIIQFMTPEEPFITGIDKTLVAGEWFRPDDLHAVIISDVTAKSLGVKVGETVGLESMNLVVRGIVNAQEVDKMADISGFQITPLAFEQNLSDPENPTRYHMARVTFLPRALNDRYSWFPSAPYGLILIPRKEVSRSVEVVPAYVDGLAPADPAAGKIEASSVLTEGTWFRPDDERAVIVSASLASRLAVHAGQMLRIGDRELEVRGIMRTEKMDTIAGVSTEAVRSGLPQESLAELEKSGEPVSVRAILLPTRFKVAAPVTSFVTLTMVRPDPAEIMSVADELAKTYRNIDVFRAIDGNVQLLSAYRSVHVSGSGLMVMPLVVSFLMIFSVMMGSVHERTREIYIFSSVGLSPRHVAGMFLIESVVYAGIASVWGYFLGIIFLGLFRQYGLLGEEFYPNYLGVFVIYSVGLAMLATISSSIYPMYKASRIANPSLERTWRIDTEPEGDTWRLTFPFISTNERETVGLLTFLRDFIDHHAGEGMGVFARREAVRYQENEDRRDRGLHFEVWLAPFERNITERAYLEACKDAERNRWTFVLHLERLTGVYYMWVKSNKAFVDALRKQMLVWRGFPEEVVAEYGRLGVEWTTGQAPGTAPEA